MERRIRSLDLQVKPENLEFAYVVNARQLLGKIRHGKPDERKQMEVQRECIQAVALTIIDDSKGRNENLSLAKLMQAYGLLLVLKPLENGILTTFRKVESLILSKYLSNCPVPTSNVRGYIYKMSQTSKKVLEVMRKGISNKLKELQDIGKTNGDVSDEHSLDEMRKSIFQAFKLQISSVIEVLIKIRPPPCRFAILGLGSLAFGDMTPYSDIEIVILFEHDDTEDVNRSYFTMLLHMLNMVIIQLRETPVRRLGIRQIKEQLRDFDLYCDFKIGFHIDPSCCYGSNCYCIETPEHLCQRVCNASLDDFDTHKYLWSVYLCGEMALMKTYHTNMTTFLNSKHDSGNGTIAQHKALQYIKVELERWGYTVDHLKKDRGSFNAKIHLYRLPSLLIRSAALFSHVYNTSSTEALVEIQSQGLLPRNFCNELKSINSLIFDTRLRVCNKSQSHSGRFNIGDHSGGKFDPSGVYCVHKETIDKFISTMDRVVAVLGSYLKSREVTEYNVEEFSKHLSDEYD